MSRSSRSAASRTTRGSTGNVEAPVRAAPVRRPPIGRPPAMTSATANERARNPSPRPGAAGRPACVAPCHQGRRGDGRPTRSMTASSSKRFTEFFLFSSLSRPVFASLLPSFIHLVFTGQSGGRLGLSNGDSDPYLAVYLVLPGFSFGTAGCRRRRPLSASCRVLPSFFFQGRRVRETGPVLLPSVT